MSSENCFMRRVVGSVLGCIVAAVLVDVAPTIVGNVIEGYEWYVQHERYLQHFARMGKINRRHIPGMILAASCRQVEK